MQRLHSLNKPRAPSGSLVPLNPDGSAPRPTLRYQPKAVQRRSREERAERGRAEEEKRQERVAGAEAAAAATTTTRRRDVAGRGGFEGQQRERGRGGSKGRGGNGERGGARGGRKAVGSGGRDVAAGGELKSEHPAHHPPPVLSGTTYTAGRTGGDRSSDESDSALPRFNIDAINALSDSEDDDKDEAGTNAKGKGKARAKSITTLPFRPETRGLRPVRIERREHVKRVVDINTEASSSKSAELKKQEQEKAREDESLFVEDGHQDVEEVSATSVHRTAAAAAAAYDDDSTRVKKEPDGDVTMIDSVPPATATEEPVRLQKKKVTIKDDPRSRLQTAEERQEFDRHEQDLEYLRTTLGSASTTETKTADSHEDDDEPSKETASKPKDERHGRLFLFQFPPMTPNLRDPAAKGDDEQQEDDGVVEVPAPSSSAAPQPGIPRVSEPPVTVKTEDEEKPDVIPIAPPPSSSSKPGVPPSLLSATRSTDLPPGRAGKLCVHKSGATTIDWGGISFKLDRGSDVGFLQDAVVVSDESTDKRVWAMSQVSGKWVVTPDWDRLLDE